MLVYAMHGNGERGNVGETDKSVPCVGPTGSTAEQPTGAVTAATLPFLIRQKVRIWRSCLIARRSVADSLLYADLIREMHSMLDEFDALTRECSK